MQTDDLWITRIQMQGQFWDTALYSGLLYLWRTPRKLHIYHWNKWRATVPLHEMPIYLSPLPVQVLQLSIGDLQPYFYKEITFEKDVRDFFVYQHRLFFLDEDGLFSLEPESAQPIRKLLAKGDFTSLTLSERNRLVLCGTKGVFEYPLSEAYRLPRNRNSPHSLQQWSTNMAHHAEWLGHDLILYDGQKQPFQQLRFVVDGPSLHLVEKRPIEKDTTYPSFYNEDLPLYPHKSGYEWGSLFGYPPALSKKEAAAPSLDGVSLDIMPNPHFPHPPLDESQLYVEEREDGLQTLQGPVPLLHFDHSSYRKWRIFSKSRHYQHHLHLLQEDSLSILLFFQRKEK